MAGSMRRASGHCQWHFFVTDCRGSAAVIESPEGKRTIYRDCTMPVKVLCNASYASELEKMKRFRGYGGNEDLGIGNREVDMVVGV